MRFLVLLALFCSCASENVQLKYYNKLMEEYNLNNKKNYKRYYIPKKIENPKNIDSYYYEDIIILPTIKS